MKPTLLKILAGILMLTAAVSTAKAQSPLIFNYQAVLRDSDGNVLSNQEVLLTLNIRQLTEDGTIVYSEDHNVTTNALGMVQVRIGESSTSYTLSAIDWSQGTYYLEVLLDSETIDTQPLVSVPYALYATKAGNAFSGNYDDLSGAPDVTAFLTSETDPFFTQAVAANITQALLDQWNASFGWGDHNQAGYLTSFTETDPLFTSSAANVITGDQITNWETAYDWGNHAMQGYITDPDDIDADTTNEIQDLTLSGNTLSITNNEAPTAIDLSPYLDNSNLWSQTDDSLYYMGGNVGIGTKDPKSTLTVAGTTPTDSAIFEVKNSHGETIFGVYEGGVRINVIEEAASKGPKGGFAIGGFNRAKGKQFDYFVVHPDSMRMNFYENPAKGPKGGFAIGGFNKAKGVQNNYFEVTPEAQLKGSYGSFNTTLGYKAGGTNYLEETGYGGDYNVSLGYKAGYELLSGQRNVFVGDSAGVGNNSGDNNVFIGKSAGAFNSSGNFNVALGAWAGYHSNSYYNVMIGYKSGYNNSGGTGAEGKWNTFIGFESGYKNTEGWHNLAIGYQAGKNNQISTNGFFIGNSSGMNLTDGYGDTYVGHGAGQNTTFSRHSTYVGYYAGHDNETGMYNTYVGYTAGKASEGSFNTFIGQGAGTSIVSGEKNVVIGSSAGYNVASGSRNVFIGYGAANHRFSTQNINDKLFIANDILFNSDPLIFGDFANKYVVINGDSTDIPTGYEFYVVGQGGGTSSWNLLSDIRMKENISTIANPLDKVSSLRGVNFHWKDKETGGYGPKMGFIAQEAVKIIPEVVNSEGDVYSMQYAPITALLVEAVKELKAENEAIKAENQDLKNRLDRIRELEEMILQMQQEVRKLQEKQ